MKYNKILEEELKNKVAIDWFKSFDTTEILGKVDFTVFPKQKNIFGRTPLLWAEAKKGDYDVITMFVQLILTIGKARTFDKTFPPPFLGSFDYKKIAFVPYLSVQDLFFMNDFNWNVAPSNHNTKEFKLIKERVENILKKNTYIYEFEKDEKELKLFISNNIANGTELSKIKIDKNNFLLIYLRWIEFIKPNIDGVNWDSLQKANIFDSDFYLADLFVDDKDTSKIEDDTSIRKNLFVVFKNQGYQIAKENLNTNQMFDASIRIKNIDTYQQFWKRYKRPPIKEFQDYIIERKDLLVTQDIRERKGAFFTPRIWVEFSQKYLTDVFGENWQDDYYIWDCAAGTGNLLAGLNNKYNIWASTIDQSDVNVMNERIQHGANLLDNHVFQFDFLNDDFNKLPLGLQEIINDNEKRKRLIIYINPPYAEVSSIGVKGKAGVNKSKIHDKYSKKIGTAGREIYALFLARIYDEINGCHVAEFSKLKTLQGSAFLDFRNFFKAELIKSFIVPAWTFDNVKGNFPIGFKIWNTGNKALFTETQSDVYNENGDFIGTKLFSVTEKSEFINKWINQYKVKSDFIGFLAGTNGNDFQQNGIVYILNRKDQMANPRGIWISPKNLIQVSIYFAVRKCITQTWLNDRDQFLFPNDNWINDLEFQNDCLVFTLFNTNIQTQFGINYWIPFSEQQIDSKEKFESNLMYKLITGKIDKKNENVLFNTNQVKPTSLIFSSEATELMNAGCDIYKYYHRQNNCNTNASLYDIREYFQGRNNSGKMNNKSEDVLYMNLIEIMRVKIRQLSEKIKPKIYEYGFLKEN